MNRYLTPAITSIMVFILLIAILFVELESETDRIIMGVCFVYALMCFLFLIFQLFAFIKAHVDYDEETESIKYKVLQAEGIPIHEHREIL